MTEKSPEELAAEVERLTRENQSLSDRLRNRGRGDDAALRAEVDDLRSQVQQAKAAQGPDAGTAIHFVRLGESFCRPGRIRSDGFTEHVQRQAHGPIDRHALIEYGEPEWMKYKHPDTGELYTPAHTFEVDRPHNPLGAPDSWHLPSECPTRIESA